jgi:WD40 repeat protein
MRILKGHRYGKPVRDLVFSSDGKKLASAARNPIVRLWDLDAGTSTVAPIGNTRADGLAFAPHGRELAAAAKKVGGRRGLEVAPRRENQ